MQSDETHHAEIERAIAAIPQGVPITMLNLMSFQESVVAADNHADVELTGREVYLNEYLNHAKSHVASVGGKFIHCGKPVATFAGGGAAPWHLMLMVSYPSIEALMTMGASPAYQALLPCREAALQDSLIIAMVTESGEWVATLP